MGIRDDLQTELAAAYAGDLADTVQVFDYTSIDDNPVYDPSTGMTSQPTVLADLNAPFVDYTVKEIASLNTILTEEERVRPTDVKAIPLQNVLIIQPKKGDIVAVHNEKTYKVIRWTQDPALATYELQLRTMKDA